MTWPALHLAQLRYRAAAEYAARAGGAEQAAWDTVCALMDSCAPLAAAAAAGERYRVARAALLAAEEAVLLAEAPLRAYLAACPGEWQA